MTAPSAAPISDAERSTAARIGQVLFKNRGWLPVPFLAVPLLVPGIQSRNTWIAGLLLVLIGELVRTAGVAAAGTVTRRRSRDAARTYGAFAWCRNPLYVGNFLAWIGFTVTPGCSVHSGGHRDFRHRVHAHRALRGGAESIGQEYSTTARTPRWFGRPPAGSTEGPHDWKEAIWSERSTVLQYVVLIGLFWFKGNGWSF